MSYRELESIGLLSARLGIAMPALQRRIRAANVSPAMKLNGVPYFEVSAAKKLATLKPRKAVTK